MTGPLLARRGLDRATRLARLMEAAAWRALAGPVADAGRGMGFLRPGLAGPPAASWAARAPRAEGAVRMLYECPRRGRDDRLVVAVVTWAGVVQHPEMPGPFHVMEDVASPGRPSDEAERDLDSPMGCRACGHHGVARACLADPRGAAVAG